MLRVFLVIDDYNELMYLQTLLKKLGFDVEGLQNQKKYADLSLGFNPQILVMTASGKKVDGLLLAQSVHKRRGIPKIIAIRSPEQTLNLEDFEAAGVDAIIDGPIQGPKLISTIASLSSLDENALFEKYAKIKGLMAQQPDVSHELTYDENGQPIESIQDRRSAIGEVTGSSSWAEDSTSGSPADSEARVSSSEGSAPGREFRVDLRNELPSDLLKATPERQARFEKWQREMGELPESFFDRQRIREFNKHIRSAPPPEDIQDIEDEKRKFVRALFKK